jgi:hypothetical protein
LADAASLPYGLSSYPPNTKLHFAMVSILLLLKTWLSKAVAHRK